MDRQMKGEWEKRMEKRAGGRECQEKDFPEVQIPGQFLIKHIGEGHVIFYVTKSLIVTFASDNGMQKSK